MKRLCACVLVCTLVGGIMLIGCSKAPEEKPAAPAPQQNAAQKSPAKGSMTDSAGP